MDQVKEILRQVAKYRFWISVCVASLLSIGAYVVGSGPVKSQTEAEIGKIESAAKDVQQYSSPSVPTRDFQPIVEEKTAGLARDVDKAWQELYGRQEPLLTWPETVSERFKKWGRSWPEDEAASSVQLAIVDYVEAYPEYVENIYKIFKPFDYETGEGVVAAPPSDVLLRPAPFDINNLPGMGKVWSAQERLWTQRTVLEVIAQVNRDAQDWDSAYIKEIKALEVGNYLSQDQRSLAEGEELEEVEDILAPGEEEDEGFADDEMGMMDPSMMPGMGGMGMGGMMGARGEAETVLFLQPADATQYKILPIMMTVLIDQDRIQNLLVELENSPMVIEVRDIEWLRPTERVVKPEKGMGFTGYGYGGGMMGGGMLGYGGRMGMMMSEMDPSMMPGMGIGMGMGGRRMGEMDASMMPGMGGMGMGMGGMMGAARAKGIDRRGVDRAEKRREEAKAREAAAAKAPVTNLFDPYYNIVQVTVYGQARFYNEPTPEEEEEATSLGEMDVEDEVDEAMAEDAEAENPEQAEADEAMAEDAERPTAEAPEQAEADETAEQPAEDAEQPNAEAEAPEQAEADEAMAEDAERPTAEAPEQAEADETAEEPAEDAAAPQS